VSVPADAGELDRIERISGTPNWIGIALLLLLLAVSPGGAAAQPVRAGDVLVSWGNRILRIDPECRADFLLSPPPLTLTSLLGPEGTDQIAIDPDGAIFAVSDGKVIEIAPTTGTQSIVQKREWVCVSFLCGFVSIPLELGPGPRGIALLDDPSWNVGDRIDLFVGCADAIWRIMRAGGEVSSLGFVPDIANYFQLTGPLVAVRGAYYYTAKGDLHGSGAPPELSITQGLGAPGNVTGLDFAGGVLVIAVQPGGDAPVAGVWYASTGGFVPLTQGG